MCRAKVVHLFAAAPQPKTSPVPVEITSTCEPQRPYSPENASLEGSVTSHQPYVACTAPHADKQRRREIKPWTLIPTDCIPECGTMEHFPEGWKFNVYDGCLTHYFEIPSQFVAPTHGAVRFIEHYNEAGPYSRFRFQVCHNHAQGKCLKGFTCTYIHALVLPQSNLIHVNGSTTYETLPQGVSLFVHTPGSHGAPQLIPSEYILRTTGSEKLFNDVLSGNGSTIHRPQHCAHYNFKKVCNRGSSCSFIHSMIPPQQ